MKKHISTSLRDSPTKAILFTFIILSVFFHMACDDSEIPSTPDVPDSDNPSTPDSGDPSTPDSDTPSVPDSGNPSTPDSEIYTVIFNTNGGNAIASKKVEANTAVARPIPDPTKLGHRFLNWYSNPSLPSVDYEFETKVNDNLTLYANWQPITYMVSFETNGGDAPIESQAITYQGTVNKPPDPTNTTHEGTFDKWFSDKELTTEYDFSIPVTSSTTLYARWTYMVTYDATTRAVTGLVGGTTGPDVNLLVIPSNANGTMIETIAYRAFRRNTRIKGLRIVEGIRTIANGAFDSCLSIRGGLDLPNSLVSIGDSAFANCREFTGDLTIPNSVTTIGKDAFIACYGFEGNLTLSNALTSISENAFWGCNRLQGNIIIPDGVTTIGTSAFAECTGFNGNLTIPNSVTTIGVQAFANCSNLVGNLTIPNSVTTIGSFAFSECAGFNGNLTIPNSVITIESSAFSDCTGFDGSLTISNNVTTIGSFAFSDCNMISGNIIIPESVTEILDFVFAGMTGVDSFIFESDNPPFVIGESIFYDINPLANLIIIIPEDPAVVMKYRRINNLDIYFNSGRINP